MPKIANIRCVLLSSPYADADDPEIKECFPNGPKRTIGMVEVTLDNGVTVLHKDGFDIGARVRDLRSLCDYWSLQGAARHVIAAFEIALWDAKGKSIGKPVYDLLSEGPKADAIQIYGSGGCCDRREQFIRELELLNNLGITKYKMRAVKGDVLRTVWVLEEAGRRGIEVGVDMCQNLADPPQAVDDVVRYVEAVHGLTDRRMIFVEEAIGPDSPEGFRELRRKIDVPVCGGEIITTPKEMIERLNDEVYDFVQPDASVMGGITAVMDVFCAAKRKDIEVVVHAWGGAAAIMASYHAAFAAGGNLVEFPMLDFPLGREMMGREATIIGGKLMRPSAPGLGLELSADMESRYPFDETAVYSCALLDYGPPPDSYWARE
jgi:L-alanine-DL-glutamate epimerase-like enolase superfamily enzyme